MCAPVALAHMGPCEEKEGTCICSGRVLVSREPFGEEVLLYVNGLDAAEFLQWRHYSLVAQERLCSWMSQ